MLSSFLSVAELDPSLRPDSVLSERGPTSSSSAANPNLMLAHLGRIKLGMEGKRMGGGAAEYSETEGRELGRSDGPQDRVGKKRKFGQVEATPQRGKKKRDDFTPEVRTVEGGQGAGEPALVSTATEHENHQWQDRENYDLAQDDDEVDAGNTQRNAGTGFEHGEETVGTEDPDGEMVEPGAAKMGKTEAKIWARNGENDDRARSEGYKVDKAERKRLKKEKSKREKKTAR